MNKILLFLTALSTGLILGFSEPGTVWLLLIGIVALMAHKTRND